MSGYYVGLIVAEVVVRANYHVTMVAKTVDHVETLFKISATLLKVIQQPAAGIAVLLGYPGLDAAVRGRCTFR